ncbi:hypothetical protein EW145_g7756 [Phellinidium pouzarii]|uniref:Tetratricopeptide repeat protein 39B n=1 Tax=Phellinidium pouzarii TaxID=167371 RepID=A0A4S4KGB6_9AGAM|nr:hypothetical protein EW145_g7756 [Phellinidium pouzarii]
MLSPPPKINGPYCVDNALDDLPAIKYAEYLFLNSNMVESEQYCLDIDSQKERLYVTSGYCLIQCLKAIMSYEDEDLQEANKHVKHGNNLAFKHRAPPAPLVSRIAGLVWENSAIGVGFIKSMTPVQRHAELLYAETFLSFRTMINIYLLLGRYLEVVDAEAAARAEALEDKSIDKDFRSGVELGVGASNLILSLMPDKLLAVAEIFGYRGNRDAGLSILMKAGGWVKGEKLPRVDAEEEGLRRTLADICLMCFHLVISTVTFRGVDLEMAETILDYNLKRYPNGVFFLIAQGRLFALRSQPKQAISSYTRALTAQTQYRSLHYISFWELAIANLALWEVGASLEQWHAQEREATWSKACYIYGAASCLLQIGGEGKEREARLEEAAALLDRIPGVVHKIAGKSIPIEKFVARKARKFASQGRHLLLPALELAYVFLAIDHAPRAILLEKILPVVEQALDTLKANESNIEKYESKAKRFWDDYCLAHFLEGVCWRFVTYPDKEAIITEEETTSRQINRVEAASRAQRALQQVIKHGFKIELDHYIVYHAHYELGRLYICMGDNEKARKHLDLVISGKPLEAVPALRKSQLMMRTTAVLEALDQGRESP